MNTELNQKANGLSVDVMHQASNSLEQIRKHAIEDSIACAETTTPGRHASLQEAPPSVPASPPIPASHSMPASDGEEQEVFPGKRGIRRRDTLRMFGTALVCIAASQAALVSAQPERSDGGEATTQVVDLNSATAEELIELPGIGPEKAEAILKRRERRPFRRIEEIMLVRGIGRTTFRKLRDRIAVGANSVRNPRSQALRARSGSEASELR
ncbi:MAG: helix-hairpin-helix domain-containing protein [Myxococcota bacterium]